MAEPSSERVLKLPLGFITLCRWFWDKKWRVWGLIGSKIFSLLLWIIGFVLVTTTANLQTLPLRGVIDYFAHNAAIYSFIIFTLILILLFFTGISYVVSHIPEASLPAAWQEEKRKREQKQSERDRKQVYLRWLSEEVRLLPRLGLGVDLIAPREIQLADVFIPLELRASPKPLRLQPLSQDELERIAGLDRQHADYLLLDQKGEWERNLLRGDRINIVSLWTHLSQEQPTAVIQGAPGMGKSTLLARIAFSLARQGQGKADLQLPLVPVVIPILILIKEYADYLKLLSSGLDRSIMPFLRQTLEQKLKRKGVDAASQVAEQMAGWLRSCQCLVMFDGLDEVSDKGLQQEIQQEIHTFIEQQRHLDVQSPSWNRFLITSRIAEYNAPALENYRYFLVAELSSEQIRNFLPRWYQTSISHSGNEESTRIQQLTTELLNAYEQNEAVGKLAGNPLLLTLMAIMLHNGTTLPERRIELYQAVVKTLLESRNEIKGLPKLYEDEAIQHLGILAFTMQGVGNNLAHRSEVEAAIKEAIVNLSGSTEVGMPLSGTVEQKVEEYIEANSKRGGLFIERTTGYYGFIHRSFQEYFAARHMLREIESNRQKKIKEYVQLLRDNPNTWREPFILAVAFKSDRDGGPVATDMLRTLLNSRGKNALRDTLLTATCITESKYINIDSKLQQDTVDRLLFHYEQAQKEQRFENCGEIEEAIQNWLLILREGETYLELPHVLHRAITDGNHLSRQRSTLTLLCIIVRKLQSMRYNLFALLIPSLLALGKLEGVPPYAPASSVSPATDLDVADLSLTLLYFMGNRGPRGLLVEATQSYFKKHSLLLRDLAHYSLNGKALITPIPVPRKEEQFNLYSHSIDMWVRLRDSYKQTHITESNIEDCLSIQQAILNSANEVRYPAVLHLQEMLQRANNDPIRWQESWQSYLLNQLENAPYVHYQQVVLLWIMLFPGKQDLEILADRILTHYNSSHLFLKSYSYRFLSTLSRNLNSFRSFRNFEDLSGVKVSRDDSSFNEAMEFFRAAYSSPSKYTLKLSYSPEIDKYKFELMIDHFRCRSLRDMIDLRDLRDLESFRSLIKLRDLSRDNFLNALTDLSILSDLVLNKEVAEKARTELLSQSNLLPIDLLTIIMGRILQLQEKGETGQQIEREVQRLTSAALDYIARGNMVVTTYETALDIVRSLPARTTNEIGFIWQTVQGTTESRIMDACAQALTVARPKDALAWQEIEQGQASSIPAIKKAVEVALRRRK